MPQRAYHTGVVSCPRSDDLMSDSLPARDPLNAAKSTSRAVAWQGKGAKAAAALPLNQATLGPR